jgi:hypothetical protein
MDAATDSAKELSRTVHRHHLHIVGIDVWSLLIVVMNLLAISPLFGW